MLVYPNTKEVALASLGFLKVYGILKRRFALADISYLPVGPRDRVLSRTQRLLLGEMSGREVRGFDLIGFSISYEGDYVNIPRLLTSAGLPAEASERRDAFPLVIGGGFTMFMNPLPVADFLDVVIVGEAEPVIDKLIEATARARVTGMSKAGLLDRLGEMDGVYVPSLGEKTVRRIWARSESMAQEPDMQVYSHFGDMSLVEVGRGCGRGCLFCAAGNLYRPVRMREASTIIEQAEGSGRVGLVGTAVGDHPQITAIARTLLERGCGLGISSLRADQVRPELAELISRGGVRTIAVAPEAGSEALRTKIGKGITRDQISEAVRVLSSAGIPIIKLYFMIGLPGETERDIEDIVSLVGDLARVRGKSRLSVAATPFVPKPHTAFQWEPFAPREVLRMRARTLRQISRIKGCSLRVASIGEAWVEAVLARGDRTLAPVLLEAARKNLKLRTALKGADVGDPYGRLDMEKPLRWDFIESGVTRKGLRHLLRKSTTG